ncbi:cyclic nucleotide-binding protein [Chloroherpeton thalassium ATCC 35110]|uniref:Cyclic nucleotide-binding protein n=1 Tax=Chloroherpeton thalassium (strain ATCC 35110 / GB-78) TaxID=517418 RepID=B3QTX5_CHLT3|nr:Crp/Fnr family transcriptional regulator [Chloroherpeton thalassium]ACF14323.1 cyclic nucleotide-binding protein [Chloroherpeton thalassium ATCC 35110]
MNDLLAKAILRLKEFNDDELALFLSCFKTRRLEKGDFFINEGCLCEFLGFVNSGMLRAYFLKDGDERILQFYFPDYWVAEFLNIESKEPAEISIQALEPCEIQTITCEKMWEMNEVIPNFKLFGQMLINQRFVFFRKRTMSFLRDSPELRYKKLLQEQAEEIEKIPLQYIASYLGIRPESLSRIRKRLSEDSLSFL